MATSTEIDAAGEAIRGCIAEMILDPFILAEAALDAAAAVRTPAMTRDQLFDLINKHIYMEMPLGQGERSDRVLLTKAAADAIIAEISRVSAAVRAEVVDIDIDEASHRLCSWLGYAWHGLRDDGRVTDHGYPPTVGGRAFQGRKEDIRDIVRAIVAAAERKEIAEINQASIRASRAAAERPKVWNPDAPAGQVGCAVDDDGYDHTVDCPEGDTPMEGPEAPPTAGPIPLAGASAGWKLVPLKPTIDMEVAGDEKIIERLNDHSFALKEPTPAVLCYQAMLAAAPSPQPAPAAPERTCQCFGGTPGLCASTHEANGRRCCDLCGWPVPQSPSEGAPDVAGLVERLHGWAEFVGGTHTIIHDEIDAQDGSDATRLTRDLTQAADALTAQAAALAAKEAECEAQRDNIRMLEGALIDKNLRRAELEAALLELVPPELKWKEQGDGSLMITIQRSSLRKARAALAGKGPQG